MSRFAGAVHLVTTDGTAGKRGATVIAACSVSDNPPMVLVCVNRENPENDAFVKNRNFAINTLTARHELLAVAFSGVTGLSSEDRFALTEWQILSSGAPVLFDAAAVFDCKLVDVQAMATHRIMFGKVIGLRIGDSLHPLIYHGRSYHVL